MEFTNEIFFNKPLKANTTVIITYFGKLYREHSKDVSIVYGYGDNWEYTESSQMKETENGFEVTLTMKDYNTFNFCFNNSFNIWDNNFGFNYIAPISQNNDDEQQIDNEDKFANDGINDDTEEVSSTPVQNQENNDTQEKNNEEEQQDDINEKSTDNTESENFEAAFSTLLDSILDDSNNDSKPIDISNLSGFGLQSVDNIKQEEFN